MIKLFAIGVALATGANAFAPPRHGGFRPTHALARQSLKHPTFPTAILQMADQPFDSYISETMGEEGTVSGNTAKLGGFALLLFVAVSWSLQKSLITPCIEQGASMCKIYPESQFFLDHPIGSFMLILTHAIPFVLIPTTMRFVHDATPAIKEKNPSFNPFVMQLGLATICFALAFEFGWHVDTAWYYANDFHILNFAFYFFLISSFALWADGFENTARMDTIFGMILLIATLLYPVGAAQDVGSSTIELPFLEDPNSAKIPLYAGMTVTFTSLTQRGWKVFGPKMGLVFFFSVIVNLVFIFLLQSLPTDVLDIRNYIYHVAHDLLGTELGVAVFAYLMATYDPSVELPGQSQLKSSREN